MRSLRRKPGFVCAAVLCVALGVSSNVAVFTLVRSELLRPLPYREPDRLVSITMVSTRQPNGVVLDPEVALWREESHTLSGLAVWNDERLTMTGSGVEPEDIRAALVNGEFLDVLGVRPLVGRAFTLADDQHKQPVVLLGHELWRRVFNGDARAIGRMVTLSDRPYEIVGVLPEGFRFPGSFQPDLLLPGGYSAPPNWSSNTFGQLTVIGRLADSIRPQRVATELTAIQARHAGEMPGELVTMLSGRVPRIEALADHLTGTKVRAALLMLMGAVALVVLIAVVNMTGLQLARTLTRRGELSVRAALGASRSNLARLVLSESLVLSIAGTAFGILGAYVLIEALPALAGRQTGGQQQLAGLVASGTAVRMDGTVIMFAISLGLLIACISGATNVLAASRLLQLHSSGGSTRRGMLDRVSFGRVSFGGSGSSRASFGSGRGFGIDGGSTRSIVRGWTGTLRYALVAGQVAIAFVLLIGAGLLLRSFANVLLSDTGVRTEHVLTVQLRLPASRYQPPQVRQFARELIGRVHGLPGVQSATITNSLPFTGYSLGVFMRTDVAPPDGPPQGVAMIAATPEYFKTFGVPILRGEGLPSGADAGTAASGPALVNEAFVKRFLSKVSNVSNASNVSSLSNIEPIGRSIRWGQNAATISGVVADVKHAGPEKPAEPEIVIPFDRSPSNRIDLAIRTSASQDPLILAQALRHEIRAIDEALPIGEVSTLDHRLADLTASRRFQVWIVAGFAAFGVLLAVLGLYASIAYTVNESRADIALRMALGAEQSHVRNAYLRRGLTISLIGLALGATASLWLVRSVESLLFEIRPMDPINGLGAAAVLLTSAMLATYLPARSAARTDPISVLRHD
jgi:putative ABC transport system permease protein